MNSLSMYCFNQRPVFGVFTKNIHRMRHLPTAVSSCIGPNQMYSFRILCYTRTSNLPADICAEIKKSGSNLMHIHTVVSTRRVWRAFVYDRTLYSIYCTKSAQFFAHASASMSKLFSIVTKVGSINEVDQSIDLAFHIFNRNEHFIDKKCCMSCIHIKSILISIRIFSGFNSFFGSNGSGLNWNVLFN